MLRIAFAAFALAAPIALALPAAAQQKMVWHTQEGEESAALVFGVPETDQAAIFFLCKPGTEGVTVQTMIGSKGLAKDADARIILTAGGTKKTFEGKAVSSEESGAVDVEAAGKMEDIKPLAKASGSLTIEVKGAKRSVALAGIGEQLAKFEAACKPKS
ncbi:hypothetical protein ACI7BZ_17195 [Xanthobacter sp. AM11]|uniref:hypothetical protein n=1 Tax=Xanthobacter sp. AM11 TaxID=3380643 RepID=UPI0039BF76CB